MKSFVFLISLILLVLMMGCAPEEEEENSQTASYSVGGSVTGLVNGTVVIQNNGSDDLVVYQPGSNTSTISFNFPSNITSGNAFNVTVLVQPLAQTCTVNNGSGSVSGSITTIAIICSSQSFTVGGTITGLNGTVVLQNNGGDDLTLSQNGSFNFDTKIAKGSEYFVSVKTHPLPLTCSASSNRGIIRSDVSSVSVVCSKKTYLLSGTASGLGSTTLTLVHSLESKVVTDNGSDNASFNFTTPVASQGGYRIAIPNHPDNRTCTVINGIDDNVTSHINNLRASCWTFIDNITQGGINNSVSQDATVPTVSIYNNKLYAAWVENNGSKDVIRISRNDDGANWTSVDNNASNNTPGIITTSGTQTSNPFLVLDSDSSITYLLWEDRVSGVDKIQFAWNSTGSSDDSIGKNWYLASSLNKNSSANASSPQGLTKAGKLYVIWSEMNNTNQIRVRSIKDVQTIDSWLDGGGSTGINDNTSHHARNPVIKENSSVFYAAWSEENSSSADNVSQIRVKKLDRSQNSTNTNWVSIDRDNQTAGINFKSQYDGDHPEMVFHDSKLFSAWQEKNIHVKNQIRIAYYDDNLTITDNGTKLVLDNSFSSTPLELSRSTCTLQNYDDKKTSLYSTFSQGNYDNRMFYFSSFDNVTLTNSVIYNSNLTNVNLENSTVYNSVIMNARITPSNSVDNASINQSPIYNSSIDNATINNSTLYDTMIAGATLYSSNIDNATSYNSTVTIPELQSSCWVFVDGGNDIVGMNKLVDADGNEDASQPQWTTYKSKLYITWTQEKSGATQTRAALFNDDVINPAWQTVDRYDEYGPSRFGLNYNEIKNASNPVMTSNGSKLFSVWAEIDNSSKSQIRVVENPL